MKEMTYLQTLELVDIAAQENRVYHHNGGQAYIRLSMDSQVLMIIDHTTFNKVDIELMDGTAYFKECAGYNNEYSARLRDNANKYGTFVDWYYKHLERIAS
jgi:hypothetical protein